VRCSKSEVVDGLGTDQRGGETSSAGAVNECLAALLRGLQAPRSFADGSESGQLTAPN